MKLLGSQWFFWSVLHALTCMSGSYWNNQNIFSNSALSWFDRSEWSFHKLWLFLCCSSIRLCGITFTNCDFSPVARPWDCVEQRSQVVTLSFCFSSMGLWHKLQSVSSFPKIWWIWWTNSWLMCSCSFNNSSVIWCFLAINSRTFAAVSRFWAVNSPPLFEASSRSSHPTLNLLNHSVTCTR